MFFRLHKLFPLLLLSFFLSACGGGGGGSGGSDDNSSQFQGLYDVELIFPRVGSNFGGASQTILRGRVTGTAAVNMNEVSSVTVNGVAVSFDVATPELWSVPVNLVMGKNTLNVVINYRDGNSETFDLDFDNEIILVSPAAVVYDHANNRAFAADSPGRIFVIDMSDGSRTWLSSPNHGTGPSIGNINDLEYDAANNRLLVLHRPVTTVFAVAAVDIATGNRSEISGDSEIPSLWQPNGMTHDSANNRLFVVDSLLKAVVEIDLSDGSRSTFSDADDGGMMVGTGDAFEQPWDIVLDNANTRLLVIDRGAGFNSLEAVMAVQLANGDRSILSDENTGSGPSLIGRTITLNTTTGRVLVGYLGNIMEVDPTNGDRSILSNNSTAGTGPSFNFVVKMDFDASTNQIYVPTRLVGDTSKLAVYMAVDATSGNRNVFSSNTVTTGSGDSLSQLSDVHIDADRNRLVVSVTGNSTQGLMAVDLADGSRSVVTSSSVGSGDTPGRMYSIAPIPATDDVYVTDLRFGTSVYLVDLVTGDRTVVASNGVGSGSAISTSGLVLDTANNRLLNMVGGQDVLQEIDPASGDRVDLSSNAGAGSGDDFRNANRMAIDVANSRVFITDTFADALYEVNTATGVRSLLPNPGAGNPGWLNVANSQDLEIDLPNNRLIMTNIAHRGILEVDLTSGFRNILSDDTTGSGPGYTIPIGLEIDFDDNIAYTVDNQSHVVYIVDLENGNRAIMSR